MVIDRTRTRSGARFRRALRRAGYQLRSLDQLAREARPIPLPVAVEPMAVRRELDRSVQYHADRL